MACPSWVNLIGRVERERSAALGRQLFPLPYMVWWNPYTVILDFPREKLKLDILCRTGP